jgi:hypothetical protein
MDNLHPLLVKNIKSQLPNLACNQRPCIAIKLSRQYPFIPIDQLDIPEIFQVSHRLCGFKSEQTATDRNGGFAFMLGSEVNQPFQI